MYCTQPVSGDEIFIKSFQAGITTQPTGKFVSSSIQAVSSPGLKDKLSLGKPG
jgi:hypothetical protein